MKFTRLLASLLSFAILFTMVFPNGAVFADDDNINIAAAKEYFVGSEREFKTINDALKEVEKNPPQSEADRTIINVDPGDYEEQVRINGLRYITLQQTPNTTGKVTLHWYFCTGYCTSNTDLTGLYDPNIDWSLDETWNGYNEGDEKFTKYEIGQKIGTDAKITKISYYDKNGTKHKDAPVGSSLKNLGGLGWSYDKMAPLIVTQSSTDITIKDLNCVNSVPTMVTKGQKEGHLTPEAGSKVPTRDTDALANCSEDTTETKPTADIFNLDGSVNRDKYEAAIKNGTKFTEEESSYLVKSSVFNERGHAIAILGDRITVENVRVSGNQDSVWASDGRIYFKNCDLIGGTDFIYGSAAAVFDNCRLGFAGFSDKPYGSPLATPNTDPERDYGYLFYNCTIYNRRLNNTDAHNFGGPWDAGGQATYYKTTLDKSTNLVIDSKGWGRFGAENGLSRLYEYGTKNSDGSNVDLSERIVNKSVDKGGPGKGTVLDDWQILEYNPRNYFSTKNKYSDDWDPMNFSETYLADVDAQLNSANVNIPAGNDTIIALPKSSNSNIEFKWESISNNAVVSEDGNSINVIRPALGEEPIKTNVVLYARNKTNGFGDKKIIDVTINPTTDTENVFNIPVTIKSSAKSDEDCVYTVTVTKNGALIKKTDITMPANATSATGNVTNIPASADGIEYDVKIDSSKSEISVNVPENGETKVTGKKGVAVPLEVTSQKLVEETVDLDINFPVGETNFKSFDIIDLAKKKGAETIGSSDIITFEFDLDVKSALADTAWAMLKSNVPTKGDSTEMDSAKFAQWRIYKNWNQLDMGDGSAGMSGAADSEHQWLNIGGKFDYTTLTHSSTTINYKTKTVSAAGSGSGDSVQKTEAVFGGFPTNYEKGKLYFSVNPKGAKTFSILNVKVKYMKVATDADTPGGNTPGGNTPENNGSITNAEISNGNTVVTLSNISSGVVVAAKYEGAKMKDKKTAPVSGNTVTIEGIEADSVFVWDSLEDMKPLCSQYVINPRTEAEASAYNIDFTKMTEVPVYSAANGQGFVSQSSAIMPNGYNRKVAGTDKITVSSEGAKVTESNGTYLLEKSKNKDDGDDYNRGGLIYRVDTAPGAYRLEVELTNKNADVAPTGMAGSGLTGTSNWDNAGLVPRTVSASWKDNVWSFDFATGEKFIEIEIEPTTFPKENAPQTVGVKSIKITPIEVTPATGKPTIHILGDSTQKAYTFNETISSWGQNLKNYFDLSKVNVINYSMGGRAMKSNYNEGRFNELLIKGKKGDFVFIHSAHNDETISTNRFSRGAGTKKDNLTVNNASYNKWLDMYVEAIKARGMTPVLVTPMPRVNGSTGKYSENDNKPNGFDPDSPANMRNKAQSDSKIGLIELYDGAKKYIDSIEGKEVAYIYNNFEAGETPANNSANGTKGDGTHYRESASKMWCKIMLQSIYDQSVRSTDTYTDKAIMNELVSYMPATVKSAVQTGDWSAVFPEMASDVSAVGVVPNAQKQTNEANYYYRNNIEKVLQLGALHKDNNNLFKPTQIITVGDFARGVEKVFGLAENTLSNYSKTYAELQRSKANTASADIAFADTENSEKSSVNNDEIKLTANQVNVTVQQGNGGTITIYNNSKFDTATTDIPTGVTPDKVIEDNSYYKFTAPSEIKAGNDKDGNGFGTGITGNYIELRNNGTKQAKYEAKADGILTVYLRSDAAKLTTCENKTDKTTATKYANNTTIAGTGNQYNGVTFDVKKGKNYEIYTNGHTGRLFGIKYESSDYPHSTDKLVADEGDSIRVVSKADNGYLNGTILINGEEKSNAMEYNFDVTGNTTVSATFTKEPDFVETTIVASDAALTREVMGAILYDAYLAKYGKNSDGSWKKVEYMKQNGSVPQPGDPNYDPNIKYEGSPYIPLCGWAALKDIKQLNNTLYGKVKEAYNLGLMRSEQGIARSSIACGDLLEPKTQVTRAKAAKTLAFIYVLTQPLNGENQLIPNNENLAANTADIMAPNETAPTGPVNVE